MIDGQSIILLLLFRRSHVFFDFLSLLHLPSCFVICIGVLPFISGCLVHSSQISKALAWHISILHTGLVIFCTYRELLFFSFTRLLYTGFSSSSCSLPAHISEHFYSLGFLSYFTFFFCIYSFSCGHFVLNLSPPSHLHADTS